MTTKRRKVQTAWGFVNKQTGEIYYSLMQATRKDLQEEALAFLPFKKNYTVKKIKMEVIE